MDETMIRLFVSISLFLVSVALLSTVGTFAFVYTFIKFIARSIRKRSHKHLKDKAETYLHEIAFSLDQFGNVLCRDLFNDILLRNTLGRKEYGSPDLTVSHVTGVNEAKGALTFMGRLLAGILNAIDENHTEKARNNEQFNQ